MDVVEFRDYCLAKPYVTESFPFDSTTLVFKVMGKMFAACNIEGFQTANLKCDPERALELRASNPLVKPGYHMNKKHWITVDVVNFHNTSAIEELIDHSYDLVVAKLPKRDQAVIKKELND